MTRFLSRTLAASAFALAAFTGCQSARMPIPATFEEQAPLAVERAASASDPYLRLGAYTAHNFWRIQAEAPRTLGSSQDALVSSAGAERYGFTLRLGTSDLWDAECSTDAHQNGNTQKDLIACTLTAHGEASDTWTLVLQPMGESRLAGVLQQDDAVYEVRGTDQTIRGLTSRNQTGYLLGQSGSVLAAVDITEGGRVWLRPSSDVRETTLLAAVSAALLVTEDVRTA